MQDQHIVSRRDRGQVYHVSAGADWWGKSTVCVNCAPVFSAGASAAQGVQCGDWASENTPILFYASGGVAVVHSVELDPVVSVAFASGRKSKRFLRPNTSAASSKASTQVLAVADQRLLGAHNCQQEEVAYAYVKASREITKAFTGTSHARPFEERSRCVATAGEL